MNFSNTHALQPFWNVAAAPVQASALELALTNNLFDYLVGERSPSEVAEQFEMKPEPVTVWLDLLWSMQLLYRSQPADASVAEATYRCSGLARRYLVSTSGDDCRMALVYRLRFLRHAGVQFEDFVRSGHSERVMKGGEATPENWARAAEQQISQEQRAIGIPAILRSLQTTSLPPQGKFLDVGGGPGHIAIAFARHLPQWTGTVCDLPATATVAQSTIAKAGMADRIDVLAADLDIDEIGNGYDLIWCSCVLHFLRNPCAALGKLFHALRPGGTLYIAHAELPDEAISASRILPFYAPMMLRGRYIPRTGQMRDMLAAAGFSQIQSHDQIAFPMTPVWLYTGKKP